MSAVGRDERHIRAHPCPICGGFDEAPRGQQKRCNGFTSGDGLWCRCSREEYSGSLSPDELGLYVHMMRGACKCGAEHGPSLRREPEATYDYCDEYGSMLFQVVRFPGKQFRQRKPDGAGGWDWKVAGVRRVLYRLPELVAADPSRTVYVVEGEKDVETLRREGQIATCNPGGAGKWRLVDASPLNGRPVTVIADRDDVGRKHAAQVAKTCAAVMLECTKGKDITEHLAAGGTLAELVAMAPPGDAPRLRVIAPDEPPWGDDEAPEPSGDGKPEVRHGSDVHRVIAELDKALGETDPLLYQRDNEIVAVAGSREKEGKARLHAGTPIIRPVSSGALLPRVTEHVHYFAMVAPKAKAVKLAHQEGSPPPRAEAREIPPTPTIREAFLSALDWRYMRPIAGITECPVLRPDGTVIQEAGYDPDTAYLYMPSCEYPRVADEPTHSDAVLAWSRLSEVFCDFPYVDASHRSAVVAAILALVARPAIAGSVPCFFFDASSRRSGKTLQVDVVSLIVSGRPASRMTYPEDDAELEKVIAGYAICGARMINFDNVERPFGGPALDKCITAVDTVDLRVLGTSTMRTLTWRSVVMASGNNVRGRGDILERLLVPRVESPLEHPEKRPLGTLRHPNLRAWVKEHRADLVCHALTILRAFCAAGRPRQDVDPWGGFEPFTELVAHALLWVGAPDPLGARRGGDAEEDPVRVAERALVHGWGGLCRALATPDLTASLAVRTLYPPPKKDEPPDGHDDLREAISELTRSPSGFAPDLGKLTNALSKLKRKPFDGKKLDRSGVTHGVARWGVYRCA